jgi:hypothetical protein
MESAASGQRPAAEVDLPTGNGTTASTLSHGHDGSIDADPPTGAIAIISPMEPTGLTPELSHESDKADDHRNSPNEPCAKKLGKGERIAIFGNLSQELCGFDSRPVELGPATGSESCVVAGNLHCEA